MRVGILTAGGDCPGLNAVIRAAGRRLMSEGHELVGLLRGYRGLAEPELRMVLDDRALSGILPLGGTIVSTSSFDPSGCCARRRPIRSTRSSASAASTRR
jgi:6-phosphofructokinase 1